MKTKNEDIIRKLFESKCSLSPEERAALNNYEYVNDTFHKNYDGDVMSDLIAAASGSLPMMTSVLVSPDGNFEYEAAHGTITDHYRRHQKGEALSSNPLATIAAWAGALKKRGELDGNAALVRYADCLGQAGLDVFEEGYLSEDLASLCDPKELKEMPENGKLMKLIRARLETLLA